MSLYEFFKRFRKKRREAEQLKRHREQMARIDYAYPHRSASVTERRRADDYHPLTTSPVSDYVPDAYRAPEPSHSSSYAHSGSHGVAHSSDSGSSSSSSSSDSGSSGDGGSSST